ncbi:hypothetical protein TSUD_161780 [Trifolium subterraneum]|uniref:Uncharacterized protein n=1 Tax=Trifolium subterraneum TaxID=3900 RepID=A0A2Z6MIX1_TRISU|nr:hypothetical protein TSUD_161780 [Trifolium subterraneum]
MGGKNDDLLALLIKTWKGKQNDVLKAIEVIVVKADPRSKANCTTEENAIMNGIIDSCGYNSREIYENYKEGLPNRPQRAIMDMVALLRKSVKVDCMGMDKGKWKAKILQIEEDLMYAVMKKTVAEGMKEAMQANYSKAFEDGHNRRAMEEDPGRFDDAFSRVVARMNEGMRNSAVSVVKDSFSNEFSNLPTALQEVEREKKDTPPEEKERRWYRMKKLPITRGGKLPAAKKSDVTGNVEGVDPLDTLVPSGSHIVALQIEIVVQQTQNEIDFVAEETDQETDIVSQQTETDFVGIESEATRETETGFVRNESEGTGETETGFVGTGAAAMVKVVGNLFKGRSFEGIVGRISRLPKKRKIEVIVVKYDPRSKANWTTEENAILNRATDSCGYNSREIFDNYKEELPNQPPITIMDRVALLCKSVKMDCIVMAKGKGKAKILQIEGKGKAKILQIEEDPMKVVAEGMKEAMQPNYSKAFKMVIIEEQWKRTPDALTMHLLESLQE